MAKWKHSRKGEYRKEIGFEHGPWVYFLFYEPLKRGYEILLVASLRPFGWASLRPLLAVELLGVATWREVARAAVVLAKHSRILIDGRE